MPKGEYQFDASNPKLKDFYEDIYSHLPADILQEFAATMSAQHSIFELQALCEKHAGMGEVIKTYAIRPLIQKDFGEKALKVYDKLIQQDKGLSLSKYYQICKKLKEEVEQLRELINSDDMKFFTALEDWPAQSAAELNNLNNFLDKTISEHYQALIIYLARPGVHDLRGITPLHWAAFKGHFATVKALLAQPGIDINKADDNGDTPLACAAYNGNCEIVKVLLDKPGIGVGKALNWAAYKGHLETVKTLLARTDIDLNKASNDSYTPLAWAAYNGYLEIVKALLARPDINVNKASNNNYTPLTWAAYKGHLAIVKELLAQPGIDANKADNEGNTPLIWAVRNDRLETVKVLLLHQGIDVNKAGNDGNTPLVWAACEDQLETVKVLLMHQGIDVNKATINGYTPLACAAYRGHLEIVEELLAQPGIRVGKADNFGMTPLSWAESRGYEGIALLIKNHIASTSNYGTGSLAMIRYALLRNQGAANNDADSTMSLTNCCIM